MPEFTGHRDIRSYIRAIWRWKLLIVVLVIGAPAVSYLLERNKQPIYQSSVLIGVNNAVSGSTSATSTSSPFTTGNISAIARLLTTTPIADLAGRQMKPHMSGSSIVGDVSASADTSTGYISITATAGNPYFAAKVANAFAVALSSRAHSSAVDGIQTQINQITAQIAGLGRDSVERVTLQNEVATLDGELAAPSGTISVLQAATANTTSIGPHKKRAVELGLAIGILLAIAAVMLLDSVDRRLRSPDDLEALTKLPLLAVIAPSAFDADLETNPVDEESFQTLRTSLTYFTVDQRIKSVLIASPGEQEGKSTTAARLALACAHAGLDVVLVDADLRRAGASAKLGIKTNVGLGLVLAEQRPVETALHHWPLGDTDVGRLRVLAAGPPPPNPAALISSEAMRELISALEHQSDLVIIDTPAALAVSDAVPLMQNVSGVVLVARMNRSKRDTVRRLQKIIESAHGRLLGTVATGVTSSPGYEKYSQAYYAPTGGEGGTKRGRRNRNRSAKSGVPLDRPNGSGADGPASATVDSPNRPAPVGD